MNRSQRGMALISSLLLLLVMTILGIAMFRTFGAQERIAGNTREKQRAIHAADSAEAYAEWWLSSAAGVNASSGVACAGLVSADTKNAQVCTNKLATVVPAGDVANVPWTNSGGTETGVTYTPPGLVTTAATDLYFQIPRFYISYVTGTYNATAGISSNSYLIDAVGWGGSPNAVSVVETTYVVSKLYTSSGSKSKYVGLGGP